MNINIINFSPYKEQFEEMWYWGFLDYIKKHPGHNVLLNVVKSSGVDITLDFQGNFLRMGHKLSNLSGIKILYYQDNLQRFSDHFKSIEKKYDMIFLCHANPLIDNVRYFKSDFAYCPYTHFPVSKTKTVDVCFVGTHHPAGRDFIKDIPNITIYGNNWGGEFFPVFTARKRAVYAKAKIILNQHIRGDSGNMRDFECLAMKTFLLSDLVPKDLEGGMVKYTGLKDLYEKMDYYLHNDKAREKIAKRGKELVKRYTYEYRVGEMMKWIKKIF